MANPKTENLGLDLVDRSSPASTYLNLQTNLDDNWERIDAQLGVQIQDRHVEPVAVTAGAQVVQGGNSPAIAWPSVEGRTLVNLIGDAGGCDSLNRWLSFNATLSLDPANKVSGANGLRVIISATTGVGYVEQIPIKAGKYYVIIGMVKNGTASGARVNLFGTTGVTGASIITDTTKFVPVVVKAAPTADAAPNIEAYVAGTSGQYAYFDEFRFYEISADEYAALDTMTPDQIAAKYPYVGTGIHGITNPTFEVVQDNLLPPFSEWEYRSPSVFKIGSPYKLEYTSISGNTNESVLYDIPAIAGETYTLRVKNTGSANRNIIQARDAMDYTIAANSNPIASADADHVTSLTMPAGTTRVRVWLYGGAAGATAFEDPVLIRGTATPTFKPQTKTRINALTTLRSTTDGSVNDELLTVDGNMKRLKRFEHVVLGGSFSFTSPTSYSGFKSVRLDIGLTSKPTRWIATKYDGKALITDDTNADVMADILDFHPAGTLYLTIANIDSGWGGSYAPTTDEIKAFFNGWRMFTQGQNPVNNSSNYNGTGVKMFVSNVDRTTVSSVGTFVVPPASEVSSGWKPYQLQYQLATPVIKDVYTQGDAVVERGDNYVNVSSTNVPIVNAELSFADAQYSAIKDMALALAKRQSNEVVLWSGSVDTVGTGILLSDELSNYVQIEIRYFAYNRTRAKVWRINETTSVLLNETLIDSSLGNYWLYSGYMDVAKLNERTLTITGKLQWAWNGLTGNNASINPTNFFGVNRIIGIRR